MKKKNILMLNYEFPPLGGGAGNATYYLLREFSKDPNLEVDLVTSSVGPFKKEKFAENITVHYLDIKKYKDLHIQSNRNLLSYSIKSYKYSKKLLKEKDYDLCHAFFGIPCGYIAMRLNLPYIVSLRGSDVPFYNERFRFFDSIYFQRMSRKIWANSKEVIANSQGLRELALQSYDGKEIKVIPNGIDVDEFKPLRSKKRGKRIRVVSVGRLITRKGYEYLIEALKGKKNFELSIIGEGDLLEDLKKLASENSVKVTFLGRIDHESMPQILNKNDIFCLPSLNEGMSNAVLEAMACGLPVITTDTGGSKELIKGNGFIVEKRSVVELKKALEKFEKDVELIGSMGKVSRSLAEEMSWKNVAEAYKRVYYN